MLDSWSAERGSEQNKCVLCVTTDYDFRPLSLDQPIIIIIIIYIKKVKAFKLVALFTKVCCNHQIGKRETAKNENSL